MRPSRAEEFRAEVRAMKVRDPATGRDRVWLWVGIVLMVGGLAVSVGSYFQSHNTANPLEQRDALAMGLGGLAATVVGAALFLRYSIAGFLRFWLARLSYEQQSQTDRVVDTLRGR